MMGKPDNLHTSDFTNRDAAEDDSDEEIELMSEFSLSK